MTVASSIVRSTVGPLAIYGVLSLAFFGRPLAHGGQELVGIGNDDRFYVWAMGWWPHTILNGENPIVTHAMWPLTGFNLAWSVTVPALALPIAPVTLLAGPAVAYNVVAVAMPALAAWTAFLLCRYLTGSWWASLAGGYLFGFSGYMLGHTTAHPGLTSLFLIPLPIEAACRRAAVRANLGDRACRKAHLRGDALSPEIRGCVLPRHGSGCAREWGDVCVPITSTSRATSSHTSKSRSARRNSSSATFQRRVPTSYQVRHAGPRQRRLGLAVAAAREVFFTKGRIIVRGKLVARGEPKRADYILCYSRTFRLPSSRQRTTTRR